MSIVAAATAATTPTNNTPQEIAQQQPKRKGRKKRPVIHEIFEQAASVYDDTFWVSKLQDAARGIFPTNFAYDKRHLIYSTKRKTESICIDDSNPLYVASAFRAFMMEHSNLASDRDIRIMDEDIKESKKNVNRGLTNKEIWPLLQQFVVNYSLYYNLDKNAKKSVSSTVALGYQLGIFNAKTVVIENGLIQSIVGFEFDFNTKRASIARESLIAANRSLNMSKKNNYADPRNIEHEMYIPKGKNYAKDWKIVSTSLNNIGPTTAQDRDSSNALVNIF
jgi:hypothetical protein